MNLNERFNVSDGKIQALRERIARLKLDIGLIKENFIRGGGKGGQKINKTANCVLLHYPPLGLVVRCQRDRRRSVNRFLALRELIDRIELELSPQYSRRLKEMRRIQKRKARHLSRARKKYGVHHSG